MKLKEIATKNFDRPITSISTLNPKTVLFKSNTKNLIGTSYGTGAEFKGGRLGPVLPAIRTLFFALFLKLYFAMYHLIMKRLNIDVGGVN